MFFSRTTGQIVNKLGTQNPWVRGIYVCLNEGSLQFPRGDNYMYEIAKKTLTKFENLLQIFRTTRAISIKLCIKHPLVKEMQGCSDKGPLPLFQREIIANIH